MNLYEPIIGAFYIYYLQMWVESGVTLPVRPFIFKNVSNSLWMHTEICERFQNRLVNTGYEENQHVVHL